MLDLGTPTKGVPRTRNTISPRKVRPDDGGISNPKPILNANDHIKDRPRGERHIGDTAMAAPVKSVQDQLADANNIIRSKNRELVAIRREVNRKAAEAETAEKVCSEIFGIAESSPEPPKWLTQEPGKPPSGIPFVQLNDWHWGETVEPDQVGVVNQFNRLIARQRVHTLFDTVY